MNLPGGRSTRALIAAAAVGLAAWQGPDSAGARLAAAEPGRPNILWITCEDMSPDLGCYGVDVADTPSLDRLATQGVLYTRAYATSGVCAPARSCLIMGVYPSSLGSQHMRCQADRPGWMHQFPFYLRQAGYFTTNNVKTDYNMPVEKGAWDENSRQAHYRHRPPGQPFFAVFNTTVTHESSLHQYRQVEHDPQRVRVPRYHPDTPEVRRDWARYHDQISKMDRQAGRLLEELEAEGLADDTIVFYFSDHGAGMPRSKRWLYESGTRVALIIRFGANFQHLAPASPGGRTERLVSFVDFAPTVLSLAGVPIPAHMQGKAFLGRQAAAPRQYVYGLRDRMDERYDMQRSVRDHRYRYIRNYMPHKTYALHLEYMYRTATMQTWQRLHDAGQLDPIRDFFFTARRPVEELYDTLNDPDEVHNLAGQPRYEPVLDRLREAHKQWMRTTLDVGLLPEPELHARPRREGFDSVYDWVRSEGNPYPLDRILETAWTLPADPASVDQLAQWLEDPDPAVRYWAALHLGGRAPELADPVVDRLAQAMDDPDPSVQVQAAYAVARCRSDAAALDRLADLLEHADPLVALAAAIALDDLDGQAASKRSAMQSAMGRSNYIDRVLEWALHGLDQEAGGRDIRYGEDR